MVRPTKLILVEGLPGSGKSTTAHTLARRLADRGLPVRWWYEEEVGHPVYAFRDRASLQQVVDDLARGEYRRVIAAALAQWRRFAALVQEADTVVLIDSCLFGYLTWSLFPLAVPEAEIRAYVAEVARIIASASPGLIYFYQQDVGASLARLCARRGGSTEQRLIQQSTQSLYGQQRGLQGFAGMVAYWTAYRQLTDAAFAGLALPKLAIETTAGDWLTYRRQVLAFFDLPPSETRRLPDGEAARFVGTYRYEEGDAQGSATISLEDGELFVDGVPHVWPHNRLLPKAHNAFAVESLPFEVSFEEASDGRITRMLATGPELLGGKLPRIFVKQ